MGWFVRFYEAKREIIADALRAIYTGVLLRGKHQILPLPQHWAPKLSQHRSPGFSCLVANDGGHNHREIQQCVGAQGGHQHKLEEEVRGLCEGYHWPF